MTTASRFKSLWNSPVGPKTVHFWAPLMKWALVIAGLGDLNRPAEKLSVGQQTTLAVSGLIWTRWCLIIKPKNYPLSASNFFVGLCGVYQLARIYKYEQSKKKIEA
ncbi:putative mitochondrial pyruvate carrier 2 [Zancudomyces culisetae]|uniref:Mitochondrial pyruvate carrier n=1 Tax=Zancudomyces culisetae TaxID=1213189 RepID=A0A1R1PV68_ZANCU|nr:putative mitochondrial pyruvate carrier 2 [Zancudomyces culisetae]|eukprot:OMH84860.1 putative mitochondrial pyruvate carrier 2 [Zancudomyces culisetae]